jgi:hypothetical protein
MTRLVVLPNLDPANYPRHALHGDHNSWVEKNCYIDLWVELVHALKLEPLAMLPVTLAIDFEGDQWTFFKPSHDELRELYGIDVQELTVWKPLLEHAVEHLAAGKLISTEADAFWLPDTAGTDYRNQHTKTTIVLNDLDVENQRLGYFHNAGYYSLQGEDFVKTFRVGVPYDPEFMPLFAELVRTDRLVKRSESALAELTWQLLHKHVARIPQTNPIARFKERFAVDLKSMQEKGLKHYNAWAFAATRQLGAAFELAAANLRWLEKHGHSDLESAALCFDEISASSKAFILKGARAVNSKKDMDLAATFDGMISAWDRGMKMLAARLPMGG